MNAQYPAASRPNSSASSIQLRLISRRRISLGQRAAMSSERVGVARVVRVAPGSPRRVPSTGQATHYSRSVLCCPLCASVAISLGRALSPGAHPSVQAAVPIAKPHPANPSRVISNGHPSSWSARWCGRQRPSHAPVFGTVTRGRSRYVGLRRPSRTRRASRAGARS
jgi:hypothetical protein